MAYQYDAMGNVIGEYESEEERKAREDALNAITHKEEVKTYGDGTQTVTTTKELPAPQVRPVAAVPMQGQPAMAISPEQMAYTQRMESGNQPNIGYHYAPDAEGQRKSSAYGAYGLTAPAYQDVQRANPAFAGRPIESLTPQDQQAAMQTYTGLNAQSLQRQGVEPTEGNVRLAHFLGAKGAADFLSTGAISPAAAAANGGEERVRQIAQQRLAGGNAPASGAAQQGAVAPTPVAPTVPSPYALSTGQTGMGLSAPAGMAGPAVDKEHPATQAISAYQAAFGATNGGKDTTPLLQLKNDTTQPMWIRERAGQQAAELTERNLAIHAAIPVARQLVEASQAGDAKASNTIAKTMQQSEGSWLKMILLGFISPQLAGEEAVKLGFGNKWVAGVDETGKTGMIQTNAKGMPLTGVKSDGTEMTRQELVAFASGGIAQKGATTHTGKMQDATTGEIYYERTTPQGIQLVDTQGKKYTGPSSNLRAYGIGSDITTKNQIQLQELQNKLAYAGPTASAAEREKVIAESEAKYGPLSDAYKQQIRGAAPQVQGTVPVNRTQVPAPAGQVAAPINPAAVGQVPAAAPAPAAPAAAPAAQGMPAVSNLTPAQRENANAAQKNILKEASDVIGKSDAIVSKLIKTERAAIEAETKPNNFGTITSGIIPFEQAIGKQFKTKDYVNTQNVLEVVNTQAAINAKMLGTNPTDRDLQFVTATKPDQTWSREDVADWLRKSADATRRSLDFARKQMETGGTYIPETPQETPAADKGKWRVISVTPGQ